MTQLLHPPNVRTQIERSEVSLPGDPHAAPEFAEDAELKFVVQDIEKADAWIGKAWASLWRESDILYQALRSYSAWEGSQVTRSNISRFTVAKLVNAVVPQILKGLFYSKPPFELRGFNISESTLAAKKVVLAEKLNEMEEDGTSFQTEVEDGWENCAIFGPQIYLWGWKETVKTRNRYVRKRDHINVTTPVGTSRIHTKESDEWEQIPEEKRTSSPFLRFVDHRHLLFDPRWNRKDIRKCRWIAVRSYPTFDEIDELSDEPGYEIPPREKLLDLFFPPKENPEQPGTAETATAGVSLGWGSPTHAMPRWDDTDADPTQRPLEMIEYWNKKRCVVALNRKLKIKGIDNEFGCIPALNSNWWNVPDSGIGIGLGRIVGQDQRVDTGVTNGCLDILAHTLNPDYIRGEGVHALSQNIRQRLGGVIAEAKDPTKAYVLKEQPRVPAEALAILQLSKAESESASGANEQLVQGATPSSGRTSLGRTATGAAGMIAASNSRLEGPLNRFINNVFIPYIYKMDELINERLPSQELRDILLKALGEKFMETFDEEEYRNAECTFEVLAGALLAARGAMAQVLPLIVEMFSQPQVMQQLADINGEYVDLDGILRAIMEMAQWRYNAPFIKPLTDQMKKARAAQQAGQAKFAQQVALTKLKGQQQSDTIDQKAQTRGAERLLATQFENAIEGTQEPIEA